METKAGEDINRKSIEAQLANTGGWERRTKSMH